jgi:hypothetical protein
MICFFWDLISLRKRLTKSSEVACEASTAAEGLTASLLAVVEFWAKTELADANTTNVRVIARNFFWFMDFLSCKAKVSWARIAARSFKRQDSSASLVPIEQHHRPRKRRKTRLVPQPFTSLHRNFEQGALAELVCQVSGVM